MDPNIRINYYKGDYFGMARSFEETYWKQLIQAQDIEAAWTMFMNHVEKAMSELIPLYKPGIKTETKTNMGESKGEKGYKNKYGL